MEQTKHNIQITNKLYSDIKEFCKVNSLKLGEYIEHLVSLGFSLERYGDVPFGTYKGNNVPNTANERELSEASQNMIKNMLENKDEAEELMGDIIENVGGPEEYDKLVQEILFDTERTEKVSTEIKEEPKKEIVTEKNKKKVTRLN